MGDRRPKKRAKSSTSTDKSAGIDIFEKMGLSAIDFEVESGGGKSFLSGQRIIWMTLKHRPSGRTVSGKIGTSKKNVDSQHDELLRILLASFRKR